MTLIMHEDNKIFYKTLVHVILQNSTKLLQISAKLLQNSTKL